MGKTLDYTITITLDVAEENVERASRQPVSIATSQRLERQYSSQFDNDTDVLRKFEEIMDGAIKVCTS